MKNNEIMTSITNKVHILKSAIYNNDCEGICHIEETAFKLTSE